MITQGRRVGSVAELERPGDYYGPTIERNAAGDQVGRGVWFLLPTADPERRRQRNDDLADGAAVEVHLEDGLHRVSEPPWTFRECPDGSLEIRASIACGRGSEQGEYWHGYLDEGHQWRQV